MTHEDIENEITCSECQANLHPGYGTDVVPDRWNDQASAGQETAIRRMEERGE